MTETPGVLDAGHRDDQIADTSHARHLQIIACAGSGKTETISRRIAELIQEGARPDSIVAFTFTERAATELKERAARRVAERMGEAFLDRLSPMFVGTIHSYCFRLLQTHVPAYGNYDVLDDHRHAGLLSREYRRLGLSKLGSPKHWQPIRDFIRTADIIANELVPPARLEGTPLGECYTAYREMLAQYKFLTFGQLIALAVEHLESDAKIYERVHSPLRYLFVDEYQDINPSQERLIALLARDPVRLTVVGDDDQSIYQWRGADVGNILSFRARYGSVGTLELETNRRSRPRIIEAANAFAKTIAPRLDKAMAKSRPGAEVEVVTWKATTPDEEAEQVADTIERLHQKGFAYREMAVLFRSVRTSAPPLVAKLQDRRIPFTCGGRTGLFLQPEVALLAQIHAWFVDGDWQDERFGEARPVELDRLVAGIQRCFDSGQPAPTLAQYLEDWKKDRLSNKGPVSLVGDLYKALRFLGVDRIDPNTALGSSRLGALARFSQALADFEHVTRRGRWVEEAGKRVFRGGRNRGKDYAASLYHYLLHYARDAYEEFEGEAAADEDAVDILTVHQSKGLEWPVVFVPALVEGRFPSRRAGQAQKWVLPEDVFPPEARQRYEGSEAEERRLFYVALTRARDCAYLSCFERKINEFKPSRFLLEVAGGPVDASKDLPLPIPAEDKKPPTQPPLAVSFSDVSLFDDCGHRYRLAVVFGFEQELAVELGYGKAIHHVLRHVAEIAQATGKPPNKAELVALIEKELYLPFANASTVEHMHKAAQRLVERYLTDYSDDLERLWAVERPFELHLEQGTLSGRADVILSDPGEPGTSLSIVDYKTATDARREGQYRLQLAVYAGAGRGEGLDVKAAYIHDLKNGIRSAVDISEEATRAATSRAAGSVKGIREARFPARPDTTKCGSCDYRRICRDVPEAVAKSI